MITAALTDFIPLIAVGVILAAGSTVALIIRSRVRKFSKNVFGTHSISEGIKNEKTKLSETPHSLHSMTSVYLPIIKKDFPEFDYELYKNKAKSVLRSYLSAINDKNAELLREECSLTLKNNVRTIIEGLNSRDETQVFSDIVIHNAEIGRYIKNGATVTILFEISVGYFAYRTDGSGKVILGDKELKTQTVYEVGLVYVQDESLVYDRGESLGVHCPNCGAPIRNLGHKTCEYCGSAIIEVNTRAWKFDSVSEQTVGRKNF